MTTIIEERLKALDSISPVLAAFMRSWNDGLDDEQRQALKPYIPRMIGTAGDGHDKERIWMAADWLVRVCTPAWLDLAGLKDSAEALRSLPAITKATVTKAQPTVEEARDKAAAAGAAAGLAAGAAVRDAAWAAVRDAVWAAAWDAAEAAAWRAAWRAAGAAAWITVRAAVQDAVRDAAWIAALEAKKQGGGSGAITDCFAPVKAELQRSAHELLDRMIDGPFGGENA